MQALSENMASMTELTELNQYLQFWDKSYTRDIKKLPIFNPSATKNWSLEQKQRFVKIFYHIRGHFHDFLWHMGSYAPDAETKQIVLHNIGEEFSIKGRSHELLYFDFAASLGIDLLEEVSTEEHYLPFVRQFNKSHLEWLRTRTWEESIAAFSAYERLDNVDYVNLYTLAEGFNLSKRNLAFFSAHIHVQHFETTFKHLSDIWSKNSDSIKNGFSFIAQCQKSMWRKLSDEIFNTD